MGVIQHIVFDSEVFHVGGTVVCEGLGTMKKRAVQIISILQQRHPNTWKNALIIAEDGNCAEEPTCAPELYSHPRQQRRLPMMGENYELWKVNHVLQ
jgi:hypothetical protein